MEVEETSAFSESSSGSLTAGDVLIRSTSFHMKKKSLETQTAAFADSRPAACSKRRICISAKKLREVPPPCRPGRAALIDDGTAYIPPALSANKPASHKPTAVTSEDVMEGGVSRCTGRHSEVLSPTKDTELSQLPPKTVFAFALLKDDHRHRCDSAVSQYSHSEVITGQLKYVEKGYSNEAVTYIPSEVKEDTSKQIAADMFISQYDTGQKAAVRAVFKQRIQNVPVFKEVKVQLLHNTCLDKKDSSKSTHSEMDSVTTIAAATAAAIASTAPLLKVQSDLEAKVSSVSEMLNKLQETDKQLQRVAEQQVNLKAQQLERPPCQQRVSDLEKQRNLFMEQRIQHLENLQQQQMNIQSHLISSALNLGGFQAVNAATSKAGAKHAMNAGRPPTDQTATRQQGFSSSNAVPAQACSHQFENSGIRRQKSPLKTPAPRRYAPVPVSKDAKISQKMSKREQPVGEKENVQQSTYGGTLGGGRLLEHILNSQETPLSQRASSWKDPRTDSVMPWGFGKEHRSNILQTEPFPAFKDPNPVERTVKKADDVLHDLGQLKREMHGILQDAKEWKLDMNSFMKATSHLGEATRLKDQLPPHQSACSLRPSSEAILRVSAPNEQKDPVAPSLTELQQLSKSSVLQSTKVSKSILRDAEKILRVVRKNKKLLEENLEAIIRAKDGNALHAFIDELTAERDVLEEIRIRKTVDEWIKTISMEIQDEMARKDSLKTQQTNKMMRASRETNAKFQYPQRIPAKRHLPATKPIPKLMDKGPLKGRMGAQNEEYLSQVYGRPIYQGHRSTLKKSPYLRFNSPSPKSKPPRPKLIESVKGTKVKSARTQTGPYVRSKGTSPKKPCPGSASHQELQYLFSPTKETSNLSGPLEGHLIPMAIPLGQKQIDSILPQPARIRTGEFHPVTVTTSVPPAPSKPQLKIKKPNIAVIEMKSEKKDPPRLTVQVLPNVDIDSISSDTKSVSQISLTPLPSKEAIQDEGDDDIPEFSEPVLEFNRQGETASPKYNGPPFPPAAPPAQPTADILDEIIERRETLENKLVGWVEQEVMARIIGGMYPPQKEAVPNISASESEDSQGVSSDIVEAAGTKGFRLFVDAGLPVDSEIIRRFVNEALAETVAVMLGDQEGHEAVSTTVVPQAARLSLEKETILSTPLATPEATPPQSPPPPREKSPIRTPESSPSVTEIDGDIGRQQQAMAAGSQAAAVSPVYTPLATPVVSPPRVATPSPPVSEHAPGTGRQEPPNAWGDVELPLEEEKPSLQSEEGGFHPRAVIMSVAKHEEPDTLVLPAPHEPTEPHDPPLQEPRVPSPSVHTPTSGTSTEESSLTATETGDRPISEGEVLFSYGQLLAAKAFAEGGLSLPNLSDSLISTLHDAREMDYDPPSEGQVLQRPHKGYHRDPVLSLFSEQSQVPLASEEEICQRENMDDSAGELSEGQRPRLTKAAESILMGHSVYVDQPASPVSKRPPRRAPSPGQCDRVAGEVLGVADVTHGPMSMAELDRPVSPSAQGDSNLAPRLDDLSQKQYQETQQARLAKPRVICVKPKSEITQQQDFQVDMDRTQVEPNVYLPSLLSGGETMPHLSSLPVPAKMSVMVPSANIDDRSLSPIHGSSDSSGADTF
ncbi:protein TALPID3 isoform X2 [Rhineura floridana]|uniref:protein TALPID3 isoform X2 n=1 Tax=Rhineura floridana TaxID=261503 RepID=UPI002AC827D1|nr:protein TALPID3 isoform X2 [Rhineura floridana]